jgi:hypothetical protein
MMNRQNNRKMWIGMLGLLLLGAHLNLTALVPLQAGDPAPPWWVGGMLLWPFAEDTNTLLAEETTLLITPLLAIGSALCLLAAAAALLRWGVPAGWFAWLIVAGVALSVVLQVNWLSVRAVLPLLVDVALLWAVFRLKVSVAGLRLSPYHQGR